LADTVPVGLHQCGFQLRLRNWFLPTQGSPIGLVGFRFRFGREGMRYVPFFDGYMPQIFFRKADVTGSPSVLGDADMAMPGNRVKLGVVLQSPVAFV